MLRIEDIKPEDSTCDFCDSPLEPGKGELFQSKARFALPLKDGRKLVDTGEWLACPECSPLVRGSRWLELAKKVSLKTGATITKLLIIWVDCFGEDLELS